MPFLDKSLPMGAVLQSPTCSYRIVSVLRSDGQGFTYKVMARIEGHGQCAEVPMVMREQMMVRCSSRSPADGCTVVTPPEIAPTVQACLDSFRQASLERLAVSQRNPCIIDVNETFEANGTYYYVVEYLDGPTLEEYVAAQGGKLTFEQTRQVLSPVLDAVRTLHMHHCLHTDITPRHIKLIPRPGDPSHFTPVLFSLYATLHFNDKGLENWTLPIMSCHEGYAPPEQYGSIDHFFPQTDIYALAATMVFCLGGKTLPDSRTLTEGDVRAALPLTLPESVVSALVSALDSDPGARTQSVSDLRDDLRDFTRVADLERKQQPPLNTSAHSHPKPWLKHHLTPWLLFAAAATIAIIAYILAS